MDWHYKSFLILFKIKLIISSFSLDDNNKSSKINTIEIMYITCDIVTDKTF